ncbi:hypothetical protein M8494_15080 [Serratia ureilytica]
MTELIGERNDVAFSCGVHPLQSGRGYDYAELRRARRRRSRWCAGETGLDLLPERQP